MLHNRLQVKVALARKDAIGVRGQFAGHPDKVGQLHEGEIVRREQAKVLEFTWAGVVMEDVEVDAGVRLATLGDEGDGRVEAGAKRGGAAELEGEVDVEGGRPLSSLFQ